MKLTDLFLSQLEAESPKTRRAVEQVPEGRDDWKPHEKSMPLGYLATLVAGMPSWIAMMIEGDELDLNPPGKTGGPPPPLRTRAEWTKAVDDGTAKARAALEATTDDHLMKPWRLLVAGKVVNEEPRYVFIRDTFTHLAHHRGQLTVYLRLNGAIVPAIYGPSADEARF
jgi:uncharacterized damage-inducible protein DinB